MHVSFSEYFLACKQLMSALLLAIKIVNFLRAANMCVIFRGLSEAFITLATDGLEAGIQAFKALSMTMRWAGGV